MATPVPVKISHKKMAASLRPIIFHVLTPLTILDPLLNFSKPKLTIAILLLLLSRSQHGNSNRLKLY